jgi:hypothetical protein
MPIPGLTSISSLGPGLITTVSFCPNAAGKIAPTIANNRNIRRSIICVIDLRVETIAADLTRLLSLALSGVLHEIDNLT